MNIRRIPRQALDRLAFRQRLALTAVVNGGAELAAKLPRHTRRSPAVDDQSGHLLPAAAAVDARLVRVQLKAFRFEDSPHLTDERAQLRLALVNARQAEGQVVGVARVAIAQAPGQSADAPIETQTERVRQGRTGRRP